MLEVMQETYCSVAPQRLKYGPKIICFGLVAALAGLPINDIILYAALVLAAVFIFSGTVLLSLKAWSKSAVVVALGLAAQSALAPPPIDEGFNVFLPGGAMEQQLPADVYQHMLAEFNNRYPIDRRCDPGAFGCWRSASLPDRAYAFAADGIFRRSDLSRSVTNFDFTDPVWHRLGFINEVRFNWYPVSDVQRASRDRRFWKGYDRWQLSMPWFTMIRLPAPYVGGRLCWSGDLLWEGRGERFTLPTGPCRTISQEDIGKRIVGVAIKPDTLAMHLHGPIAVQFKQWLHPLVKLLVIAAVVLLLVRIQPRRATVPLFLIALAVAVIGIDDSSFLGGVRPMDGGDDGMFYDSVGRDMLQKLLAGNWAGFLEGGESVFYYGGPALRYFRAIEHLIFGDTYLGYLSLVLALPLIVLSLFAKFLSRPWPLVLAVLFVAVPLGHFFGTTFFFYAQWASRGFADPACYILFMAGLLPLLGSLRSGSEDRFWPDLFGALLIALAIGMKPLVAPAAAVFLGGAGLVALYRRKWFRLAGMCVGFLPVFSMAWHNWVFGGRLVLFSDNAGHPLVLVMPPSAWIAAIRELIGLDLRGEHIRRAMMQISDWLAGPAQADWTIPVNAAGVATLFYVVAQGREFDPRLRLVGAAALVQHAVSFFYIATPRYHFLTWLLTFLVCAVFVQQVLGPWLSWRFPAFTTRVKAVLWPSWLNNAVNWIDRPSPTPST